MEMPPLPPPVPSIKLTLEGLATLLGLKVCSHGDLGFAFGSGPVLASHEAATITREVVANLRAIARESAAARDDARTKLDETAAVLAEVTEILHRAWPEHMSGDPVQLAKMTTAAAARIAAAEVIAAAGKREAEERAASEISRMLGRIAELEYQRAEGRKRLSVLLGAPADEDLDDLVGRIRDLLELRPRYDAVKARAEADELEIRQLTESLHTARSAESTRAEQVNALLAAVDVLAPKLPSCLEANCDRLGRAIQKIKAAALFFVEPPKPTASLPWHEEDLLDPAALTMRVLSPIHELYRGSAGASGRDLPVRLGVSIAPGRTVRVPTGVRVAIPEGFEGQVRPRSSASTRGLLVHLGTIDADYRGEIEIIVTNLSGEWASVTKPVAQLVICPVAHPPIEYVEKLDDTARGSKGFGSSDVIASGGYVGAVNIETTVGGK